jgi:hypothetical protein
MKYIACWSSFASHRKFSRHQRVPLLDAFLLRVQPWNFMRCSPTRVVLTNRTGLAQIPNHHPHNSPVVGGPNQAQVRERRKCLNYPTRWDHASSGLAVIDGYNTLDKVY